MSELPTNVETDPPPVGPALVTRAKVVRESFTALRSDFEINNAPPPVARPQRPSAAAANNNVQNNARMSIGGVLVLVVIAAFLVYGYLPSAKGKGKPDAAASDSTTKPGSTTAEAVAKALPPAHAAEAISTHHAPAAVKSHKTVEAPVVRAQAAPQVLEPKRHSEGAAETVALPRPRRAEAIALPPVAHHTVAAPAPHLPPKVVAVAHHEAPAHVSAPHESHTHSSGGGDIGSGHNAGDITDPLGLGGH